MHQIEQLNLNTLRIFAVVYRHLSMTGAAKELHLTQSGVSQHIKGLEEFLGLQLFDRVKQKLVATSQADVLYQRCQRGLRQLEETILDITERKHEIYGVIKIGVPPAFGHNVLLRHISDFGKRFPQVQFHIEIGLASEIIDKIARAELDFGFIDALATDKRIFTRRVYYETIELCASPTYLKGKRNPRQDRAFYESLDYIAYLRKEPITREWFRHHLTKRALNLNVRAYVIDCHSVARLILDGLGVGVLPKHMYERLVQEGNPIHRFQPKNTPLRNAVSLAYLQERTLSTAADTLRDELEVVLRKAR